MQIPLPLLESLAGIKGFDIDAFKNVHASGGQITSIRLNPSKKAELFSLSGNPGISSTLIPWTKHGYYLSQRPSFTFDPLFHAGCYYVQEASSMFLEQAILQTTDISQSLRVLDLCAAPGGKSTHIQSLISNESLLVSNDVIRARASVLNDNLVKWGSTNVVVTNNDPRDFSRLENYFDLIVVDAPCSGSGLFRRDPEAIEEWSVNNVQLCSQRQQRILAAVWPSLKKDGLLIYSTCSYSLEEDEEILQWIKKEFSVDSLPLALSPQWNICEVGNAEQGYGYRFWPDKVKGEGFFLACFRKKDGDTTSFLKVKKRPEGLSVKEKEMVKKWTLEEGLDFIRHKNTVYAWPDSLTNELAWLLNNLRVVYSGTIIGELMHDKLVPHHALAMSRLINPAIPQAALSNEEAIRYLQRKDMQDQLPIKGWQLVTYEGKSLGWINNLSNRINNYYPKELRILKDK